MLIPTVRNPSRAMSVVHARICQHEAGHVVVGELLGMEVDRVECRIWWRERRHVSCAYFLSWRPGCYSPMNSAIVSRAGLAAEDIGDRVDFDADRFFRSLRWGGPKVVSDNKSVGQQSRLRVVERKLLGLPAEEGWEFRRAAWLAALELVEERVVLIDQVAEELRVCGEVSGSRVREIMGLSTSGRVAACLPE